MTSDENNPTARLLEEMKLDRFDFIREDIEFKDLTERLKKTAGLWAPKELRIGIRDYIKEYNSERPHESHQYATPDDIYNGCFTTEDKAAA